MQQVVGLACFAGAATVASFFLVRSARYKLAKFSMLKATGAKTEGKIISAHHIIELRIRYEFTTETGKTIHSEYRTRTKGLKPYAEGDSVEILYAPDAPRIHTIAELFDDKFTALAAYADRISSLPWQTAIIFALVLWRVWVFYSY